jgi:predicted protein tyrosine phosphatase
MDEEYDVVIDVLTKHKDKLQEMIDSNMRSEFFMGLNIVDDIRFNQIEEINKCIELWRNQK